MMKEEFDGNMNKLFAELRLTVKQRKGSTSNRERTFKLSSLRVGTSMRKSLPNAVAFLNICCTFSSWG